MRFFDSHMHISEYQDPDRALDLVGSAKILLLACSVDRDTSMATLDVARTNPGLVKPFVGVHPSEADKGSDLSWLDEALGAATGAGEIGLDPKYSEVSPSGSQMAAFKGQLSVAEKAGKPVQVHSRGAERECLGVLSSFRPKSVLLHWFQGEELFAVARDRGYFVSFGPVLLYSKRLQRMASAYDRRLVLTETDAPLAFEPLGGASGPFLIPTVVFKIAELWQMDYREAGHLLFENGLSFLRVSKKG